MIYKNLGVVLVVFWFFIIALDLIAVDNYGGELLLVKTVEACRLLGWSHPEFKGFMIWISPLWFGFFSLLMATNRKRRR